MPTTSRPFNRRAFLRCGSLLAAGALLHPWAYPILPPGGDSAAGDRENRRRHLIRKYGRATKLPAFEFHGDYYSMAGGGYAMDPETFAWLMKWFQDQEVFSATADELIGFLDGTVPLPSRSVVLTTDSGNASMKSMPRMIPVLQATGHHFISFIWTHWMDPTETRICKDDLCWSTFREAKQSGVFSFGTHSESHSRFSQLSSVEGMEDLVSSRKEIEDNLGVRVSLVSWPFESVPRWAEELALHGFEAAFGGNSRDTMDENAVLQRDPQRYSLPRIFPPNRYTRRSGRPNGRSIEQIMTMYTNGFDD